MAADLSAEMARLLERVEAQGYERGLAQATTDYYGRSASVLLANIFADAAASAEAHIRAHDTAAADLMKAAATQFRAFATPAAVKTISPADGATQVAPGDQVVIEFTAKLDPTTVTADNVFIHPSSGGSHLAAALSYSGPARTVTLNPENDLSPDTDYKVTVKGTVKALGGQPMGEDYTITFRTAAA